MPTPDEYKASLMAFKKNVDSDDIRVKEIIKKELLKNPLIFHVLNNKELEANIEDDGTGLDEYFGVNILPYYIIAPTQTESAVYICYEVSYTNSDVSRSNHLVKNLHIVFYILCDHKVIKDEDTGIARHDLLAALIQDIFNYSNAFGSTITLVGDTPSVIDKTYACRTLTFEQITDNNVVKTKNGRSVMVSHG